MFCHVNERANIISIVLDWVNYKRNILQAIRMFIAFFFSNRCPRILIVKPAVHLLDFGAEQQHVLHIKLANWKMIKLAFAWVSMTPLHHESSIMHPHCKHMCSLLLVMLSQFVCVCGVCVWRLPTMMTLHSSASKRPLSLLLAYFRSITSHASFPFTLRRHCVCVGIVC